MVKQQDTVSCAGLFVSKPVYAYVRCQRHPGLVSLTRVRGESALVEKILMPARCYNSASRWAVDHHQKHAPDDPRSARSGTQCAAKPT